MLTIFDLAKMDVDAEVAIEDSTGGAVSVLLHPLVILNISEHYTRIRAQGGEETSGA
jgi:hypothetical protein